MFCPYCGFQNPDDSAFCSKCGKRIQPLTQGDTNTQSRPQATSQSVTYAGDNSKIKTNLLISLVLSGAAAILVLIREAAKVSSVINVIEMLLFTAILILIGIYGFKYISDLTGKKIFYSLWLGYAILKGINDLFTHSMLHSGIGINGVLLFFVSIVSFAYSIILVILFVNMRRVREQLDNMVNPLTILGFVSIGIEALIMTTMFMVVSTLDMSLIKVSTLLSWCYSLVCTGFYILLALLFYKLREKVNL